MRILMACQFYPPDIGGEERHVANLAIALVARGHDVDVLTSKLAHTKAGQSIEDGVTVHRVRSLAQRLPGIHSDLARPHAAPFPDFETRRVAERLLRDKAFDVVHAHNWIVNSVLGPSRHYHVPLVLTLHDYSHICAVKRYMNDGHECTGPAPMKCLRCSMANYGSSKGAAISLANAVSAQRRRTQVASFVPVSDAVAERNRVDHGRVTCRVIPNFIPDELLVSEALPSHDGPLFYLGDLKSDKGVDVLLRAYARLGTPKPPLTLIGRRAPDLHGELPRGAMVLPPLEHGQAMKLMRQARLVIVPSLFPDPCPTVVLEAMAAGRPVVASATGGIVDMVEHDHTGLLVEPGDELGLAESIAKLLDAPARAEEMAIAGLARVRRFTASTVVEELEALYGEVCRHRVPEAARRAR